MSDEGDGALILLASGQTISMRSVLLYDERLVNQVAELRTQAIQKMGGVSTGVGFIGSPGWVLGASAMMGLLEGAMTRSSQKQGAEMLAEAHAKSQSLVNSGQYCSVSLINNSHLPYPALWSHRRDVPKKVDIRSIAWTARTSFLKQNGLTKDDVKDNHVVIPETRRFVHNGDEFIDIDTDVGPLSVRWSRVAAYSFPKAVS